MILERISRDTGMSEVKIASIIGSASHLYKTYQIEKRRGGMRTIHHPTRRLKLIQRWIARNVLNQVEVSDAAKAYVSGTSISDNARPHTGARYILKVDFRDFFPSIKVADLQLRIGELGLSAFDVDCISRACFRFGKLTIGAPSSPMISNIVMRETDALLIKGAASRKCYFTRYADDLTFSANCRDVLFEMVEEVRAIVGETESPKLTLHPEKTSIVSSGNRQVVTGLVLTTDGKLSLGRERKRQLRAMAHQRFLGKLSAEECAKLEGWLAYAESVEQEFVRKIRKKFPE